MNRNKNTFWLLRKVKSDIQSAKDLFVKLLGVCTDQKIFRVIVDYREVVGFISIVDRLDYLEGIDALHNTYRRLNMPKLRIAYLAPLEIRNH